MKFETVIYELKHLVRKPPEDVTAKMQLHALSLKLEKAGLPNKQAESEFLQQLKMISRMTIDKEIFITLEKLITLVKKDGITA